MKSISKQLNENKVCELLINIPKTKKKREKYFDENGVRLTKNGVPYKIPDISKARAGLSKWREAKAKAKEDEKRLRELADQNKNEDDDDDDDDEYEVEEIQITKKPPKEIIKEVEKEVIKEVPVEVPVEVIKPDLNIIKENEELKQKNKKLQETFNFNQHLNKISAMSRNTTIKF